MTGPQDYKTNKKSKTATDPKGHIKQSKPIKSPQENI